MPTYKYKPIELERSSYRLLKLLKGQSTEGIQCDLFEALLEEPEGRIPYDALSYTWGSRELKAEITISECTMGIPENLFQALKHFRCEDKDQILWIDAICINQSDQKERGHQVNQMGKIYKYAERVIIWLGLATNQTDTVMNLMKQFEKGIVDITGDWRHWAKFWMDEGTTISPGYKYEDKDTHQFMLRKGMEELLVRPWFRRIWVIQEVANARVATIVCGSKSVTAKVFAYTPTVLDMHLDDHCQAVLDIMPGFSRKESWWSETRDLYTLLQKFSKSEATDPRDMVYALLGISTNACDAKVFNINYEKSLDKVIRDTIYFLLFGAWQESILHEVPKWTLLQFFQNLQNLHHAVLIEASQAGDSAIVKSILETGQVHPDSKDSNGRTPLSYVAGNGHEDVVKLLLEKSGVNPDSKDTDGQTPLWWAAMNGHRVVVKLLLEKGAGLETKSNGGQTPLSWAAENGHETVVKLLLEKGAKQETKSLFDSRTPLSWAAWKGHEAVVKLLLEKGASQETISFDSRTPLSWASEKGHEAVVKLLLEKGVKLETKSSNGRTPLSWAAENGHEAVVKLLLEKGAELDGRTPLLLATKKREAGVKLLPEKDAEPDTRSIFSRKPLLLAAKTRRLFDGRTPLSWDAETKSWFDGRTPLSWAAENGHKTVVKLLLERGAELETEDKSHGRTPLSWAAENGHEAVVELLLEKGAELEAKDKYHGWTPLSWAAENGHNAVVKLLLESGEELGTEDKSRGRTPLSWAAENGHEAMVKLPTPNATSTPKSKRSDCWDDCTESSTHSKKHKLDTGP